MANQLVRDFMSYNPLLLILYIYLGLFLGGFLHEFGHFLMLRVVGGDGKIEIMKNTHSNLIFFNMRTVVRGNSILFNNKPNLLKRSLAGFYANFFFWITFFKLGFLLSIPELMLFASLQGFSAHGASSFSSKYGDTDLRNIIRTLNMDLSVKVVFKFARSG